MSSNLLMLCSVTMIMLFMNCMKSSADDLNPESFERTVDGSHDVSRRGVSRGGCRSGVFYSHYRHQRFAKEIRFRPPFKRKPHLVYGMIHVDYSNRRNMRLTTWVTSLTRFGYTYHMHSWGGSFSYKIGTRWMACP